LLEVEVGEAVMLGEVVRYCALPSTDSYEFYISLDEID
jgi:hypothetical protein